MTWWIIWIVVHYNLKAQWICANVVGSFIPYSLRFDYFLFALDTLDVLPLVTFSAKTLEIPMKV